jgi:GTP-binding protein
LPEIAFLGRSNVGKSSLINAIVGRRSLAHVSKTPGKTRTCNVYDVGHRYYLVDLPGYGYARASHKQRAGFAHLLHDYLTQREPLAGAVWLLDVRHDPSDTDFQMGDLLEERGVPVLVVLTKADKVRPGQRDARRTAILAQLELPEEQSLMTSVTTREGLADLRRALGRLATAWTTSAGKAQA